METNYLDLCLRSIQVGCDEIQQVESCYYSLQEGEDVEENQGQIEINLDEGRMSFTINNDLQLLDASANFEMDGAYRALYDSIIDSVQHMETGMLLHKLGLI